jgi:hypothetical protein
MMAKILVVFILLVGPLFAQNTTVFINDSNGNQTTGTISNGNVYFHDSNGNVAFGTIRDGNVFLSTDKGDITFGTIKNGNVFLTDQKGITTGTIRNGNIFLSNSDGSITTGTYTHSGDIYTSTSGSGSAQQQQDEEQKRIQQQNYEAGAAMGNAAGGIIGGIIRRHKRRKFCDANPDQCKPLVSQQAVTQQDIDNINAQTWKIIQEGCQKFPDMSFNDPNDFKLKSCSELMAYAAPTTPSIPPTPRQLADDNKFKESVAFCQLSPGSDIGIRNGVPESCSDFLVRANALCAVNAGKDICKWYRKPIP